MTAYTHPKVKSSADAWDLVRAAQGGDRDAFGQLYARHRVQVQRFLRSKVDGRELAEDLTSETFLRALRRIDSVAEQRDDPGAWLFTIARNLVLDHYKSHATRRVQATAEVPEPRQERVDVDPGAQVQLRADRAAAAVTVARLLERLTPAARRAVEAYDLAEAGSVAEAAQTLGRTSNGLRAERCRAVRAMREQLAAEGLSSTAECADAVGRAEAAVARLRHQRLTRTVRPGPGAQQVLAEHDQTHHQMDTTGRTDQTGDRGQADTHDMGGAA